MRPQSLMEVARITADGGDFDFCLANFLDAFYAAPRAAALADAQLLLGPLAGERGVVQDAYLAATAEHLAHTHGVTMPAWIASEARKLHRPWFASSLGALRAALILESPAAFRARNLFVSENALSRA